MIDDIVISLPHPDLASVTFSSGEDINFSTLNSKLIKLLENDIALFNLKEGINNSAVKTYEILSANKWNDPSTITETDLIWWQYEASGKLTYPNIDDGKHINILAPIIPPHISWDRIPVPTKVPDELSSINQTIKGEISSKNNLTTYDYILNKVYQAHLAVNTAETSSNIVRYDAMYFSSLNRHQYLTDLYNAGYRWGEILMTEDSIANISSITKHIKLPIIELEENTGNSTSSSIDNTYGIITNTNIIQNVLDDSGTKLLNLYPSGTWIRKIGNALATIGGVFQVLPESTNILDIRIDFPVSFHKCINVSVNSYNNTDSSITINNPSTLYSCPITILKIDNTGVNVKLNPDYYNNINKTIAEFNIIWKAEGILNAQ